VLGVLRPGVARLDVRRQPARVRGGPGGIGLLEPASSSGRARELGAVLHERLGALVGHGAHRGARAARVWAGIDIDESLMTGRGAC
jgi:ornithine--oxo-acid transaminase